MKSPEEMTARILALCLIKDREALVDAILALLKAWKAEIEKAATP